MSKKSKYDRILSLYSALIAGGVINKSQVACEFGVNERTIQRDIDDIRAFFDDNTFGMDFGALIEYDRARNGYRMLEPGAQTLTNKEILTVCKILLKSHTLAKDEMMSIVDKLMQKCVPLANKRKVYDLINNDKFYYIESHYDKNFVDKLWDLGMAILEQRMVEITYVCKDTQTRSRRVKPMGIVVEDHFFYLAGCVDDIDTTEHIENSDGWFPMVLRLDRITELNVKEERFHMPYTEKFDERNFLKHLQSEYSGKKQRIRFKYMGPSVEAMLKHLNTAEIVKERCGGYIIEAEVFGGGWRMWDHVLSD